MALLLGLAISFLLYTTGVFLHNRYYFSGLQRNATLLDLNDISEGRPEYEPLVSVLIPARDEERSLPALLESLQKQTWKNMEILVLDDASADDTLAIANNYAGQSMVPFQVKSGTLRPDGWLGKNWACHQLANSAKGDILLFLDADTCLSDHFITALVKNMYSYRLDFLTVWPHQIMKTLSEKAVVSTVYATLITYLPTYYSYKAPRWIPFLKLREKVKPLFAAACGQCMAFTRKTYDSINGHVSVKDQIVEDMKLARVVVKSGHIMRMFHGTDAIWCRMYETFPEVYQGFRKNFFAGYDFRFLPFSSAWLLHIMVFLLPPAIFITGLTGLTGFTDNHISWQITGIAAFATAIPFLQRLWVALFLKWPRDTSLLHLPGVIFFLILTFVVIRDYLFKIKPRWKGRFV